MYGNKGSNEKPVRYSHGCNRDFEFIVTTNVIHF